jgi:Leucine-rich repeat (LRR) protein
VLLLPEHPSLQNLETLVNLRRASFVDNQISHIEGLSACTALEELCLEDNRIATIEGLQGLTRWDRRGEDVYEAT